MTTAEILSYLRSLDVKLWLDGDRLRYSAPPGALTPDLLKKLTERKKEIIKFLEDAGQASRALSQTILPVSREHPLPLSFAQERLWVFDRLNPHNAAYNVAGAVRLRGTLDLAALRQTFEKITERHEILRTIFALQDDRPVQIVLPGRQFHLPLVDLRGLAPAERESAAQRLATDEARRPFDLSAGPLLRVRALRLDVEEHILLVVMHHIVSDGWSQEILMRELAAHYEAFAGGVAASLTPLPFQYGDFAVWQRAWLQGEVLEKQLAYWKRQLEDLPALELPADYSRPGKQTFHGAIRTRQLPRVIADTIDGLCRSEGATLYMTLLAALAVLLHRYTGQDDIPVGAPIANRNRIETESLIGFFVNTMVMRADLSGDPPFVELLRRVRKLTADASAHQDIPFEKLVNELQPKRDMSYQPLIRVMFVLQQAPASALALRGLELTPLSLHNETAKFELTLRITENESGLEASVEYNTDLFHASRISRLLEHFQNLLEGIIANPRERISRLPLLTEQERDRLRCEGETIGFSPDVLLQHLFEAQVERTPEAVAVVAEQQSLTYRELDGRANRLAHRLRALGAKPETLIGLYAKRTAETVTAMLAVLKTGAAYVALDPQHPPERLQYLLAQAGVQMLLVQGESIEEIQKRHALPVISLDDCPEAREESFTPASAAVAGNPAYLIYTSGSTGKPKGVVVEHRSLVNYVQGIVRRMRLETGLSFAMVQPLTVDASLTALYPPLITGGCVHIIAPARAADPRLLAEYLQLHHIDCLKLAPSHLAALHASDAPQQLMPQQWLIMGGEPLRREWVESLQSLAPACRLLNQYGPTEATVAVLTHEFEGSGTADNSSMLPCGRPLPNTHVYLFDKHLQLVPSGVPGELYIGGDCLARGYVNDPALTAESFIPDSFSRKPGARLYKTGDMARYLPDGSLLFIGRTDDQVKIRGFRVEPSEICAALRQHPDVRDAVVLARAEEMTGDKHLVAYVVSTPESRLDIDVLQAFLRRKLPDYFIPSAFVELDEMPRTPHGKLNHQALSALNPQSSKRRESFAAPRDPFELQLARIWENVLKISPISIKDNFFELGGNSLSAVHLIARLQNQFGQSLALTNLLQEPTVERMALRLRKQSSGFNPSPLVAIQTGGSKQPFFCVHAVGGNVLSYFLLAHYLGHERPFYGLQSAGLYGEREPLTSIEEMAAYYIEAITEVQPDGPYLLGGWSLGGVVALEMAQQLRRQGREVSLVVLIDSRSPHLNEGRTDVDAEQENSLLAGFIQDLCGLYGTELPFSLDSLREPDTESLLNYVLEQVEKLDLLPAETGLAQLSRFIRIFKSNRQALRTYMPSDYRGKVLLLRAGDVAAQGAPGSDLGWKRIAAQMEIQEIPGDHYSIIAEPHVQTLAQQLKTYLDDDGADEGHRADAKSTP